MIPALIEFPETVYEEWRDVAEAANAPSELRKKIAHDTLVEKSLKEIRIRRDAEVLLQQETDADLTPTLEMMTLDNYQNNPTAAPTDFIEGVVKADGLCIMLGPSGSGKSTTALQMVHSMMTGTDWFGQTATKISGGVGILAYDMDASMVMDWMAGYPGVDPTKISAVNAYKRGNPVNVPAMRAQIADAWRAQNTEVVVLDSFSASFFGHDQNDAALTMAHYRDMKLFALTEVGARVLIVIVHSTDSNPAKARGSTVHHDVADSIVSQSVDASTGSRALRMVKYRAARGQVQMDPVVISAPDSVTHLCELDFNAMTMAGMSLPSNSVAAAFPDLPDTHEAPDTDSEQGEDDET